MSEACRASNRNAAACPALARAIGGVSRGGGSFDRVQGLVCSSRWGMRMMS